MDVLCNQEGVELAYDSYKKGGVIVFPTDTVYGIGCDPYNKEAVKEIFKIKQREGSKSFPILGFSLRELEKIAVFNEKSQKIVQQFWPGPLTLITEIKDDSLAESLNLSKKIAIRIPKNNCILSLLEKCKLIVGTSANVSGNYSYVNPIDCKKNLSGYDVFLDGGIISERGESTIIEVGEQIKIHRKGAITENQIMELF